jgi:hypothetical protein
MQYFLVVDGADDSLEEDGRNTYVLQELDDFKLRCWLS